MSRNPSDLQIAKISRDMLEHSVEIIALLFIHRKFGHFTDPKNPRNGKINIKQSLENATIE